MTRIDRRALFTSGAAAALLAATGLTPGRQPQEGGRLRLAVPRDDGSFERATRGAVYDSLTEIAPDGVLRPELAVNWSGSSDARDWQFDLRTDVLFHDGSMMSADDVVLSLLQQDIKGLDSAKVVGEASVLVKLDRGNPDFPFRLAHSDFVVAPNGNADVSLEDAIGTGAYQVNRAQNGRSFLGEKVSDHYKKGQAAWADSVEVVVIPDARVRAEALRDGFVDVAALPHPQALNDRTDFVFHPSESDMALVAHTGVGVPARVGSRTALDDGRIAERWWIA